MVFFFLIILRLVNSCTVGSKTMCIKSDLKAPMVMLVGFLFLRRVILHFKSIYHPFSITFGEAPHFVLRICTAPLYPTREQAKYCGGGLRSPFKGVLRAENNYI